MNKLEIKKRDISILFKLLEMLDKGEFERFKASVCRLKNIQVLLKIYTRCCYFDRSILTASIVGDRLRKLEVF